MVALYYRLVVSGLLTTEDRISCIHHDINNRGLHSEPTGLTLPIIYVHGVFLPVGCSQQLEVDDLDGPGADPGVVLVVLLVPDGF